MEEQDREVEVQDINVQCSAVQWSCVEPVERPAICIRESCCCLGYAGPVRCTSLQRGEPDHWRGRGCSESELHRSLGQTHAFPALSLPAHHSAQPKLFPHTDTHSVDKSSQAGWIKGVFFYAFPSVCERNLMVLSCRGVGFGRSMLVIRNVSVDSVCLGDFKGKGHMGSWSFWSAGLCWWWWWGGAEKKRCRAHGALGKLGSRCTPL